MNDGDEAVGRTRDHLLRRRELAQRRRRRSRRPCRRARRVLVVVRDEQRRQAELAQQLLQLAAHGDLRVRVERRERLVEEQHARDRAPAPARARPAGARRRRARSAAPWRGARSGSARGTRRPARARRRRRSAARSCAGRARTPGRRARRAARRACGRCPASESNQTSSSERDPPGRRPHEPRDRAKHRRLARSGRPDERDRPLDLEARALELERPKGETSNSAVEGCQKDAPTLRTRRIARLMTTSSALIASAIVELP